MERSEKRFSKASLLVCAVHFVCLHVLSILLDRSHPNAATNPFLILAPAIACASALYRVFTATDRARTGWLLFALALFLWTVGMAISCWDAPEEVAWFSDFGYFLYGVPILLILSLPTATESVTLFLWLDAIQVSLTACLIYIALFGGLPFLHGQMQPVPSALLVSTYTAENVLLAVLATLRLVAFSDGGAVRRRYALLAAFLWIYAVCAGSYNVLYARVVFLEHRPIGVFDVLTTLPFVFLSVALLVSSDRQNEALRVAEETPIGLFLDSASPILYTLTLLALGILTLRNHFALGVASVVAALVFYVIRSAVLQIRYLTTQRDLRETRDLLEILSQQDALTGIPNRRRFEQTLDTEWNRAYRAQTPLSLLLIDIDHFKAINDRYGHPYGDKVLREVAIAIQGAALRGSDLVARYGGEEFVVVLPASDVEATVVVGMRILQSVRDLDLPEGRITVSVGAATHGPAEKGGKEALIASADEALYLAKGSGRNRMEFAERDTAYCA